MISFVASYPKSGNTWVRLFLEGYLLGMPPSLDRISIVRSDTASALYDLGIGEVEGTLGWTVQRLAALLRLDATASYPRIFKTHSANLSVNGLHMLPKGIVKKALYLVRDPRDVAASYTAHLGHDAVDLMLDEKVWTVGETPVFLSSWNSHVMSWLNADFPVAVVKYEQLLENPLTFFAEIVKWFDLPFDLQRVKQAVEWTSFEELQAMEEESGFCERPVGMERFFRSGKWTGQIETPVDFGKMFNELYQ